jgi:hypothetical protein
MILRSSREPSTQQSVDGNGSHWSGPSSITTACAAPPHPDNAGSCTRPWWNAWSRYELGCPDEASYREVFGGLREQGDRGIPSDATAEILALGVGVRPSAEDLFEAYSDAIPGTIGLDWRVWEIETEVLEDDSVSGLAYRLVIEESPDGFFVTSATVEMICTRGTDPSGLCV